MCGVQNPFVFGAKARRPRAKHETGWLDNAAIGLTDEE